MSLLDFIRKNMNNMKNVFWNWILNVYIFLGLRRGKALGNLPHTKIFWKTVGFGCAERVVLNMHLRSLKQNFVQKQ